MTLLTTSRTTPWWRDNLCYEIFPRSFADSNGDGIGDFKGITSRLRYLANLGVNSIWLTPFYPSPQADAGYDVSDYCNVDPIFGTLDDFDALLKEAHAYGIRVIIDIVPNHTSDQHPWFKRALAAAPGSAEREWYHFRDGRGDNGELPPNNWTSLFGGSAWKQVPGEKQWYLHLFSTHQTDLNWDNAAVRDAFDAILKFWLDRGVDGLRIDAANNLVKAAGLPDTTPENSTINDQEYRGPMFDQDGVHDIYRRWRKLVDTYDDRIMVAEAFHVQPISRLVNYVRSDELHQAFNFDYQLSQWGASNYREIIEKYLTNMGSVDAPCSWVTSSHDQVRIASRLGLTYPGATPMGLDDTTEQPNEQLGLDRARALIMLTMLLPGALYLYQGEELGLPNHTTMAPRFRRDPRFFDSNGTMIGRDGQRIPMPWKAKAPAFGFGPSDKSWLPQPDRYSHYAADVQEKDKLSTLSLYRRLIALRSQYDLGVGTLQWFDSPRNDVLVARNGSVCLYINFGYAPLPLPAGKVIAQSCPGTDKGTQLPGNSAVWLALDEMPHAQA